MFEILGDLPRRVTAGRGEPDRTAHRDRPPRAAAGRPYRRQGGSAEAREPAVETL